ncbi:MAG: hypothetical protein FH751_11305 [Firmicutes bacterium]|nr:hypothetical protein [Bacillota bacterium]
MKTTIKIIAIILLLLGLVACHNDANDANDADRLKLYILRHVEGTNDLVIDESPIITGEDILSYEWDTHKIVFKDEFLSSCEVDETKDDFIVGGSKILGVYYPDQFAVYIDDEELYRGHMKPQAYISFMPRGPMISNSDKGIIIECLDSNFDTRNNEKQYEVLKNNDLLK